MTYLGLAIPSLGLVHERASELGFGGKKGESRGDGRPNPGRPGRLVRAGTIDLREEAAASAIVGREKVRAGAGGAHRPERDGLNGAGADTDKDKQTGL